MKRLGDLIIKQSKVLLENKQQAILCAVAFSILPFASWLSVALVALVTLRKGAKYGFEVLLPALVFHSVPLMMLVPLDSVLINTLITYIPCFIAALVLRKTVSLQMVSGALFLQILALTAFVQAVAPNFILNQFEQFKSILLQYQDYQVLFNSSTEGINTLILAQLFFGIQILSVILSTVVSLMCARSVQAKLFMPGAFRDELLAFRSGKIAFLLLLGVSIAAYFQIAIAITLLPFVLSYFAVSGFGLAYFILARKRQVRIAVLLILLILLKPTFVLFAYLVLGTSDSLVNFRLYLPARVREST